MSAKTSSQGIEDIVESVYDDRMVKSAKGRAFRLVATANEHIGDIPLNDDSARSQSPFSTAC
jgi:hypothetical protein